MADGQKREVDKLLDNAIELVQYGDDELVGDLLAAQTTSTGCLIVIGTTDGTPQAVVGMKLEMAEGMAHAILADVAAVREQQARLN